VWWRVAWLGALIVMACTAPTTRPANPPSPADAEATVQMIRATATAGAAEDAARLAVSAEQTTTAQANAEATAEARAVATVAAAEASEQAAAEAAGRDATTAETMGAYLARNFGMPGYQTSWYSLIAEATIQGNTAVIRTTAPSSPQGRQSASLICSAVSGFTNAAENRSLGITAVQVYGENNTLLVNRRAVSERC
jgi:hypothetical protein